MIVGGHLLKYYDANVTNGDKVRYSKSPRMLGIQKKTSHTDRSTISFLKKMDQYRFEFNGSYAKHFDFAVVRWLSFLMSVFKPGGCNRGFSVLLTHHRRWGLLRS